MPSWCALGRTECGSSAAAHKPRTFRARSCYNCNYLSHNLVQTTLTERGLLGWLSQKVVLDEGERRVLMSEASPYEVKMLR